MDAITVAVIQMAMDEVRAHNLARAERLTRDAARAGAQLILLPELFEGPYFPREIEGGFFSLATVLADNPAVRRFSSLCAELGVVMPISFFEHDPGQGCHYNSVAMLDADGSHLGCYRKTHIPDGAGYEEKYYFAPGDTGFKVFQTRHGKVGVGICWDQWFPECARAMTLKGADILLYPTAIGSEPEPPHRDTRKPWRRVMQGHAVANTIPVAASNRVGVEGEQRFYGTSFICDGYGEVQAELGDAEEGFSLWAVDCVHWAKEREFMGLLRDRRPGCYGELVEPPTR